MSSELTVSMASLETEVKFEPVQPQGGAKPNPQKSSNSTGDLPIPEDNVPRPDGDPFEYLLKPMLEEDTVQCDAWKDEVQNILIFAGLFSAVVTTFIIDSYHRLQPDSNDAIVGLLAHIADRLDNAPNKIESVSSIIANTGFTPSRSDVNINVFWFISLVLSLTAALIGIVALQWLREHQRYDSTLKSQVTMAILNARRHSLKQWYVPQIFAGLPLLLQGALVLFFAGMVEFLFALRLEVAIPVTLAICVPLIFLIATTILPILQVYILQDAFRLSINNDVPAPCPYKSPQSLVARRVGLGSSIMFKFLAAMVAGAYICVIEIACFIKKLAGYCLPIFHLQQPHLKLKLHINFPEMFSEIRNASGDWISTDISWLKVRTTYAMSLRMVHRDDNDLVTPWTGFWEGQQSLPELYDGTRCFHEIVRQNRANVDLFNALYACIEVFCSQATRSFLDLGGSSQDQRAQLTDLCFAFGRLICYDLDARNPPIPITAAFISDVLHQEWSNTNRTVTTLPTSFMASWVIAIDKIWHLQPFNTITWARLNPLVYQLVVKRLGTSPERLFLMSSNETWLPSEALWRIQHLKAEWDSVQVHQQFISFLEGCSTMPSNSQFLIRPAPAKMAYGAISAYMGAIQTAAGRIPDTLVHLTQLCSLTGPQNLIQEKPFLLVVACFYLDAAASRRLVGRDEPLLKVILKACGTTAGDSYRQFTNQQGFKFHTYEWTGLDDAINAIYKHHNPSGQPTSNPSSSTSPINPNGHDHA